MNPSLEKLARDAQSLMPGWPLEVVPHIETGWARTPMPDVAGLAASLAEAHPEAGRHYWAFRTWGLLVWQPVYLTLAGVHLERACIRSECLAQRMLPCMVWGCRIADHAPFTGTEDDLLEVGAAQLRNHADVLLETCSGVTSLHPKAAGRLMADCVTAAMLRIMSLRPGWSPDEAAAWGERWLKALHLDGAGGFLKVRDAEGGEHLAMDRKVCCLVYKTQGGELCDTCPRIPLQDRIAPRAV